MQLKYFQALIDMQPGVDVLAQRTHNGGKEADHGSEPGADVASCGGDANEASDGAFAGANDAETALVLDVVDDYLLLLDGG